MQQAVAEEVQDPTAMCIATVGKDGMPSQRTVLLKQIDEDGLVFFTNMESRKAQEISNNSRVSLHFSWLKMDRQVSIEGNAKKLGVTSVFKYFVTRPRESQLAAWSSPQSRIIETRSALQSEFHRMQQKFDQGEIPLPDFWGGFRVKPIQWEFWQGGEFRLHDRFQYKLAEKGLWSINRLAP